MASVDAERSHPEVDPHRTPGRTPLVFVVAVLVVVVDQLSKTWAVRALAHRAPIHLIGSLQFSLQHNSGSAFSLGRSLGPLIGLLAAVVVVVLALTGRSARTASMAAVIGLLIGGALGNLGDRALRSGVSGKSGFLHGAVVDFIDLQWWPVFNVADASIVVGGVLLALMSLRGEPASRTRGRAPAP